MNLPGLLIEYLINGSVALLWIGGSFAYLDISFIEFTTFEIILIPIAYMIGMFIDYIAWLVKKPFKKIIRNRALQEVTKAMKIEGNLNFEPDDYNISPNFSFNFCLVDSNNSPKSVLVTNSASSNCLLMIGN